MLVVLFLLVYLRKTVFGIYYREIGKSWKAGFLRPRQIDMIVDRLVVHFEAKTPGVVPSADFGNWVFLVQITVMVAENGQYSVQMMVVVQNDWDLVQIVERLGTDLQTVAVVFGTLVYRSRTAIALSRRSASVVVSAYRLAIWAFASVVLRWERTRVVLTLCFVAE